MTDKPLVSEQRQLGVTGLPDILSFLVQHCDLDELRALCFDLGANYDDLAGATLSGKARELVLWAGRQRKLDQLLAALRAARRTPFERAGLSLEPSALERLYGSLAVFESSTAPQSAWTRFRRRPWVFYPTLALVVILALVLLVSGLVSIAGGAGGARRQLQAWGLLPAPRAFAPAAEDEPLVVIATFHQLQGVVDVGAQDEIRRRIRQAADEAGFTGLRVEVEPAQLAAEDQAGARALGERYRASMVIWGEITGVRVTVNYLNLKQPDFAARVKIEETERTQLTSQADPDPYSSFITQDLPGQMTFLSLFGVGQSFYSQERYDESIRAIERAVAEIGSGTVEGLAEAYFRLGWLYQHKPDPDKQRAIDRYAKAIELKPDYAMAYNNRGVALAHSGDLAGAIADYDQAIALKPDYAMAYNNRGRARYDGGDLAGAIVDYDKAIALQPAYAMAYNNRGLARYDGGDLAGAIADYDQAAAFSPDDAETYNDRGVARYDSGDLAGAIVDYDKAIELAPAYATAYSNRGVVKAQRGDLAAAIADYDKAIELAPAYALAYNNRGLARHNAGDLAGAIADLDKAIELEPAYATAYRNRGHARRKSGDLAGAIADYTKAGELAPDDAAPLNSLCWTYALEQQAEQALPYCERAVELDPHPNYRDSRGIVYALLGRYDAAIADFQIIIDWLEQQPGAENQAMLAQRKEWVDSAARRPKSLHPRGPGRAAHGKLKPNPYCS